MQIFGPLQKTREPPRRKQCLTEVIGGSSWEADGQMVRVAVGVRGLGRAGGGGGVTVDFVYVVKIDKDWVRARESTGRRTQCESCGRRFHFTRT